MEHLSASSTSSFSLTSSAAAKAHAPTLRAWAKFPHVDMRVLVGTQRRTLAAACSAAKKQFEEAASAAGLAHVFEGRMLDLEPHLEACAWAIAAIDLAHAGEIDDWAVDEALDAYAKSLDDLRAQILEVNIRMHDARYSAALEGRSAATDLTMPVSDYAGKIDLKLHALSGEFSSLRALVDRNERPQHARQLLDGLWSHVARGELNLCALKDRMVGDRILSEEAVEALLDDAVLCRAIVDEAAARGTPVRMIYAPDAVASHFAAIPGVWLDAAPAAFPADLAPKVQEFLRGSGSERYLWEESPEHRAWLTVHPQLNEAHDPRAGRDYHGVDKRLRYDTPDAYLRAVPAHALFCHGPRTEQWKNGHRGADSTQVELEIVSGGSRELTEWLDRSAVSQESTGPDAQRRSRRIAYIDASIGRYKFAVVRLRNGDMRCVKASGSGGSLCTQTSISDLLNTSQPLQVVCLADSLAILSDTRVLSIIPVDSFLGRERNPYPLRKGVLGILAVDQGRSAMMVLCKDGKVLELQSFEGGNALRLVQTLHRGEKVLEASFKDGVPHLLTTKQQYSGDVQAA